MLVNNFAVNSSEFGLDIEDYLIGESSKYALALIVCVMIFCLDEHDPIMLFLLSFLLSKDCDQFKYGYHFEEHGYGS